MPMYVSCVQHSGLLWLIYANSLADSLVPCRTAQSWQTGVGLGASAVCLHRAYSHPRRAVYGAPNRDVAKGTLVATPDWSYCVVCLKGNAYVVKGAYRCRSGPRHC